MSLFDVVGVSDQSWIRRMGRHPSLSYLALGTLLLGQPATANATELVDDFEAGVQTNLLGGAWTSFADASSSHAPVQALDFSPGYTSDRSGHFGFTLGNGTTYPYAGVSCALEPAGGAVDLSGFAGVRFFAKGTGSFVFAVGTTATAAESNPYGVSLVPSSSWALYQYRFTELSQTWGTHSPFDAKTCTLFQWTATGTAGDAGELFIDNVELFAESEAIAVNANPIVVRPKVNQLGYLPSGEKHFTMTVTDSNATAAFRVLRVADDGEVFSGVPSSQYDESTVAGEAVVRGDFSSMSTPGRYYVAVGSLKSAPFDVGTSVYEALYRDAIRAFYIIRSGVAINDPETGIAHAASHTSDALLRSDPSKQLDLTGGWYNAGDFGKWSHMAAISSSYMLWLYELGTDRVRNLSLGIPESANAMPDLLDQARWGLEWLLKMQLDDGSVMHKVDTEPYFAWGLKPEDDPNTRYASAPGTIDTADLAAVMSQAARVFQPIDPEFASRCSSAAERAFSWVDAQPSAGNSDPYYTDASDGEERLWALSERAISTQDSALLARLERAVAGTPAAAVSWRNPALLGYFSVARSNSVPSELSNKAIAAISTLADQLVARANANGYGVSLPAGSYYWGSVEDVLHSASALLLAHAVTGDSKYRDAASTQLDYVLGINALDRSFVTKYGDRPVLHPYHWASYALHVVMPGWASGGPNAYPDGADLPLRSLQSLGTPPAKCFVDEGDANGSAASNEGQTTENAVLAFVTGYLTSQGQVGNADAGSGGADGDAGPSGDSIRPAQAGNCDCTLSAGRHSERNLCGVSLVCALAFLARRRRSADERRDAPQSPLGVSSLQGVCCPQGLDRQ